MTTMTTRNRVGQAVRVVSALTREIVRQPRNTGPYIARSLHNVMDADFSNRSPIPLLPTSRLLQFQSVEITLPPIAWLQPGNQSLEGLIFLVSAARILGARRAFEIGTYNGVTAWTLARNVPGLVVDTLDLPPEEIPLLALEESDNNHRGAIETRQYTLPLGSGLVEQHWGDSATFDFSSWTGRCDLVYVDGAHSAAYVESDTQNAMKMASAGGVVIWDDYWRQVKGVRTVLNALDAGPMNGRLFRVPTTRLVILLPDAIDT